MGNQRDNVLRDVAQLEDLPSQPEVAWRSELDGGYAGPAVGGGRVFVTDYVTSNDVSVANFERNEFSGIERVLCFDQASGKLQWKHEYPVKYTVSYPAGPRCTPTIDDDRVYTLGTEGDLFCFRVTDGSVVWSRNLREDFNTKAALWGYASHPLIDGDRLICVVGGEGSHMVAFDKKTGDEIWRQGTAPEQGYVPPTIIEAGGVRQLISGRPDAIASLDPETGKTYWSVPYEATNGSIIMSPVTVDVDGTKYLYIGGYDKKNLLLKLDPDKPAATWVWQDEVKQGISPVNVQPLVVDGIIYGLDQKGTLMAVEIPSGDRLWETSQPLAERPLGTGTAFIVRIDSTDRFLMFTEMGDLVLGQMDRSGFKELDRANVIQPTGTAFGRKVVWSAPAYADGKMFVRNDKEIVCVRLTP
ncbi:PQQ-binding-like beta-propeller repeat protein [Roseiconus nitratireducens]|nr:PQQ-binding-like beta-propeller repeat protein [Roseiconus nitratireducens]